MRGWKRVGRWVFCSIGLDRVVSAGTKQRKLMGIPWWIVDVVAGKERGCIEGLVLSDGFFLDLAGVG
jgi:hypothetical protein